MNIIKKIYYPEVFQGKYKKKNYFEGWYFKSIDITKQNALSIIPGISLGKNNNDIHAFIQILNKNTNNSIYVKYDIDTFKYNENIFEIEIDNNYFSSNEMHLHICNDLVYLKGSLLFYNKIQFPKTILRPGIMGPFSYIPFMECYHGIVSIHHEIEGSLDYTDKVINFDKGYGYIEKDWGKSFPSKWIWFQSNHFNKSNTTIMFSIAKIPWLGRSFVGFISFLRIEKNIYFFATYTKAKIIKLEINDSDLKIIIKDKDYKIQIHVIKASCGILKAPKNGEMSRDIYESIDAEVTVKLEDSKDSIIFEGNATNTGLEIMCDKHDFSVN